MIFQKDFPQYISSSKYAATSSSSAALAEMILVDVPNSSSFSTKTTKRLPRPHYPFCPPGIFPKGEDF
jgi:hypothetical protein